MPTTATIIAQASIGQYLSSNEYAKKLALKGGSVVPLDRVSRLIYICRKAIDFVYQKNPTNATLISTGNYLYWLVGKYNNLAANIISGGGTGQIINPSTGTASTVLSYFLQFVVGEPGAPMVDGQTSLVISATGFIENSVDVALDGVDLPVNRTDRWSFTVDYSNPVQITITFNQGLQGVINGQLYEIRGLRLQAVAQPSASETYLEVATYAQMLLLATGNYFLSFLVINDEVKGQTYTRYEYWPDNGIKEWIAAVEEP